MNKIDAIIIDDELPARTLLESMIRTYTPKVNVVGSCEDVPQGVKAIKKLKPALVFLDIEMPKHSGLELLDFFLLNEIDFEIIFVTGYSEYAIHALKLSAVDYLLKPVDIAELELAIQRYEQRMEKQKINFNVLQQNLKVNDSGRIAVPSDDVVKLIEISTIKFLKADSSYTEIHFIDSTSLITSRTLKNYEGILLNSHFFRCHKSYLVNTLFIKEYVKSDGGYLVLKDNTVVPISPDKAEEFLNHIKFVKRT